jgi:hypothetical protein
MGANPNASVANVIAGPTAEPSESLSINNGIMIGPARSVDQTTNVNASLKSPSGFDVTLTIQMVALTCGILVAVVIGGYIQYRRSIKRDASSTTEQSHYTTGKHVARVVLILNNFISVP